MKAKTVGAVATQYKDPAIGVEGMECVVQWSQDGRILVTGVMGHLEEQPNMNVFQNQHQVILFPEAFILSIIEYNISYSIHICCNHFLFFHFEKDVIQMEDLILMYLVYSHSFTKAPRIPGVLM